MITINSQFVQDAQDSRTECGPYNYVGEVFIDQLAQALINEV